MQARAHSAVHPHHVPSGTIAVGLHTLMGAACLVPYAEVVIVSVSSCKTADPMTISAAPLSLL